MFINLQQSVLCDIIRKLAFVLLRLSLHIKVSFIHNFFLKRSNFISCVHLVTTSSLRRVCRANLRGCNEIGIFLMILIIIAKTKRFNNEIAFWFWIKRASDNFLQIELIFIRLHEKKESYSTEWSWSRWEFYPFL